MLMDILPDISAGSSSPAHSVDTPQPQLRRSTKRGLRARFLAVGLGFFLFWGIPELLVRWIRPPLPAFRTITFGDLQTSPKLFVKDARLGWALRPDSDVRFMGRRVLINRQGFRGPEISKNRDVILCFGDSTTFGWGVGQGESFAAQLSARLEANKSTSGLWQVVDAGVPAYSSCQLRISAEQLIPQLHPTFVIVCTGNNEAWPVERSDKQVYLTRSRLATAIRDLLGASRFLSWVVQSVTPDNAKPYRAPPARLAVPRVNREELRENLTAIVRLANQQGARMIFISPTVNLFHEPIERELLRLADTVDHRDQPEAPPGPEALQQLALWRADLASVKALLGSQQIDEALAEAHGFAANHPDDSRYEWLLGVALASSGRRAEGNAVLERAFEMHPYPDRCKPSYRSVIEHLAASRDDIYIDANRLFETAAGAELPLEYYLDWCHPSAAGHSLIAQALFDAILGLSEADTTSP
jgi:lysophospholipase L1-like esterase